MLALSGIGGYLLLKRKKAGIGVCLTYIAIKAVFNLFSEVVAKRGDPEYEGTAWILAIIYLAFILIIAVYYEKRKALFNDGAETVKIYKEMEGNEK